MLFRRILHRPQHGLPRPRTDTVTPAPTLPDFPFYVVMTNPQGWTDAIGHPTRDDALKAWQVVAGCGWRVRVLPAVEWQRLKARPVCPGADFGDDVPPPCGNRHPHGEHPQFVPRPATVTAIA